jgi:hypothetical protein
MARTNLFLKLEIEHDKDEAPERLADELCRKLVRLYGVRKAELSSYTTTEQ